MAFSIYVANITINGHHVAFFCGEWTSCCEQIKRRDITLSSCLSCCEHFKAWDIMFQLLDLMLWTEMQGRHHVANFQSFRTLCSEHPKYPYLMLLTYHSRGTSCCNFGHCFANLFMLGTLLCKHSIFWDIMLESSQIQDIMLWTSRNIKTSYC
jgi:hypothetical protein